MTTFDNRDKTFENKFAHDEELAFKANVRRNKLLGLWAAEKLGKTGDAATGYAKAIAADIEHSSDQDLIAKLMGDFGVAGLSMTAQEIQFEMKRLMPIARKQIMGETN